MRQCEQAEYDLLRCYLYAKLLLSLGLYRSTNECHGSLLILSSDNGSSWLLAFALECRELMSGKKMPG